MSVAYLFPRRPQGDGARAVAEAAVDTEIKNSKVTEVVPIAQAIIMRMDRRRRAVGLPPLSKNFAVQSQVPQPTEMLGDATVKTDAARERIENALQRIETSWRRLQAEVAAFAEEHRADKAI